MAVVDPEVDGFRGAALEDDHVVTGELEFRPPVATRVGGGDCAGEGALAEHHVAPAGGRVRAGQRPGGEDDLVLRPQRVAARVSLLVEVAGGEPAAADVLY